MTRRRGLLLACVSALLAAPGCPPASLPPEPYPPAAQLVQMDRGWAFGPAAGREIRTAHYRIFTTATDDEIVRRLPLFLETAYLRYQQMVPPSQNDPNPMEVYFFDQRAQWERFTDQTTGPAAAVYRKIQEGGYVEKGRAVFYDIRRLKTFAVTGHEGFHQYVWHCCRHRPPSWLDEGLACYFESFSWEGEQIRFQPRQNLLRLRALRFGLIQNTLLDLDELLRTHPGLIIGRSPGVISSYYAQLWSLVMFLREGDNGKYRAGFERMLAEAGTDAMLQRAARAGYHGSPADFGPAVFKAYIGDDLPAIQKEFYTFCRQLADL